MPARLTAGDLVPAVRELAISPDYVRDVIARLTSIGSSDLGYRNAGTPEDDAVAAFVADEMRAIGLSDVALEPVAVDAWRFRSADVRINGEPEVRRGSCFGGVPGTSDDGVTARLVDVGHPTLARLDRLDLDGGIALVDWTTKRVNPAAVALELTRRGVRGIILCCPPGGAWFQGDDALGAFDAHWPDGAPPLLMIGQRDAADLRRRGREAPFEVTMTVRVEITSGTTGTNVVGYLPGIEPGPIVVGAHHDAWFQGAFDNTSGVAAMLALARALHAAGHVPRHTICFTSRTGEEFGLLASQQDWCIGAWRQIDTVHPEWGELSPFHLCLEASGRPGLRTIVEAPVEYRAWARAACRVAAAQGWTPTGWRVAPPVAGTEQWPYLLKGVPGVAAYAWETSFADTDYHTQLDTPDTVDNDLVVAQTRLYALLLLDADRRPDDIVDHRARARELAKIARLTNSDALAAAAEHHGTAVGRAAFTPVGRQLHALDAEVNASYPHEQALRDVTALERAIAALDAGDPATARRNVGKVGSNRYHRYLSKPALQAYLDQSRPDAIARSWGAASHLTPGPNLWDELTALSGGAGTAVEPWVRASLERARESAAQDLTSRLNAMARSVASRPSAKESLS